MDQVQQSLFQSVEIEINSNCNLSCSYCPNSVAERKETGQMRPELFLKIIKELQEINYQGRISFHFYSEPLLNKDLAQFVQITKAKLPSVTLEIYSNGIFLTEEKFRSLAIAGVDKFIVTRHKNISEIAIAKFYSNLTVAEKSLVRLQGFEEIQMTNRGGLVAHQSESKDTTFMPCEIPAMMLTITVLGSVVPCFEDFHQKNQMGNVQEEKLMEIWNKQEYVEMRKSLHRGLRHKYEVCRSCDRLQVLKPVRTVQSKLETTNLDRMSF